MYEYYVYLYELMSMGASIYFCILYILSICMCSDVCFMCIFCVFLHL